MLLAVWCNKAAEVGESAKQGRREWLLPQCNSSVGEALREE